MRAAIVLGAFLAGPTTWRHDDPSDNCHVVLLRLGLFSPTRRWLAQLGGLVLGLLLAIWPLTGLWAAPAQVTAETPPQSLTTAVGSYQLAKVKILGIPVLAVASPTLTGAGQAPDAIQRAKVIEGNLDLLYRNQAICTAGEESAESLLETYFIHGKVRACGDNLLSFPKGQDNLKIQVVIDEPTGLYRLEALVDGRELPLPLLTVTADDAHLNGTTQKDLAGRWRELLEHRLRFARQILKPEALLNRAGNVLLVELVLLLVLGLLLSLWRKLRSWLLRLELRRELELSKPISGSALHLLQNINRALLAMVLMLCLMMAGVALFAIPGQLPTAFDYLLQPAGVLGKVLSGGILAGALRLLVGLLLAQWVSNVDAQRTKRARRQQRYRSMGVVFRRLVDIGCISLVCAWVVLDIPGVREISNGALLASGAFLGALALVFQGLLRDFVAGLVMLFDDRYALGDQVTIAGLTGEVVDIGLLSTELRCLDQRAVVLQNSSCEQVVNYSKLRSGADIQLVLSHDCTDLPAALALMAEVTAGFSSDPAWKPRLLEEPRLRGVSAVGPKGISVSVVITTEAGAQGPCERELLQRLLVALQEQQIPLARS